MYEYYVQFYPSHVLLQPNIGNLFHVETLSTAWTLAAAILDVDIDALSAEHMSATQQNGILIALIADIARQPALENLDGLFVVRHRIGLLKGFLRDSDANGFIKAEIAGLTNTLRFQHKTVVNLPKVSRTYGYGL